jgi:AcrR family transcriptional regulator
MPPRPSRNLDRALLAAGRELFPHRGCAGLSVREVADAAEVNLGMFHYHFKSREAFLRAVMQQAYEEMFSRLTLVVSREAAMDPVESLRRALGVLGRFARDNRPFLARVFSDALAGEAIAREFLRDNVPRHLGVLRMLITDGQDRGALLDVPFPQVIGLFGGSLLMPILVGGALLESGELAGAISQAIEKSLVSDAGIDQRIELAIRGLSSDRAESRELPETAKKKRRGKP